MRFIALTVLFSLAACASQIMQSYVGKDVQEVILERGPPIHIMEMGEGKRAYQWKYTSGSYTPGLTNSVTSGGIVTNSYSTPGFYSSRECVYSLFAKQVGGKWIVESFKDPGLDCE